MAFLETTFAKLKIFQKDFRSYLINIQPTKIEVRKMG